MNDLIKIVKNLIETPSLSGEEKNIAYLIRDFMNNYGIDKSFIDKFGNVIGTIKGELNRVIVFEGHMDHVPPGNISNWRYDPYKPRIIGNRIYGRGAVDMKGAIASMIYSIHKIKEKDIPSIYYIFVPYEEISEGVLFKRAIEETLGIKPDLVVLGEATNLNLYIGQRGRTVIKAEFHGISAHASMPDMGLNALKAVSKYIWHLTLYEDKLPVHPVLGRSSVEPTIIECSPKSPPMIPDKCLLTIDYRMILGETRASIINFLNSIAGKLIDEGLVKHIDINILVEEAVMWTGTKIVIEHYYPSWLITNNDLINKVLYMIRSHNPLAKTGVWRFSTDGVYSAGEANIPTIGIGPGDERLAHKPNEFIEINQLFKASDIYSDIVNKYFMK
ncbi:MAG: YgeY family selenium metabolism-linked hydrolase [Thermoprotei archaeon]|nr:MAG: YgeY family selenium metabolism-linked hydrolase [Thermoprotei archaeon]